ncbi:MAG: hypothetical protein OCU16_06425 [Candidatus Methanospirare jalkutatii]|nr:hypothetical protein [Candidatus Methanospirare jalkutatii]
MGLCEKILESDYELLTVERYLTMKKDLDKFIIMRHDVDDGADLPYTLAMARKEADLGISATYYFRVNEDVFKPEIIREIASLGHEIGYHYDVLGKADGDYERAIKLFEHELNMLRAFYDVKTIAMHGGPFVTGLNAATFSDILKVIRNMISGRKTFVNFDSRDLWKIYNFENYGIIGDAYLSINFSEVAYISDTNRSWSDTKHRLRDFVERNNNYSIAIKNTDNLIRIIEEGIIPKILILTHPPNWRDGFVNWVKWLMIQKVKNIGKTCLKIYWKNYKNEK